MRPSSPSAKPPAAPAPDPVRATRPAVAQAFWVCLPLFLLALAVAVWNPAGDFWGAVEPPKAQCEAYHSGRLQSASALTVELYDQAKLDRLFREPQNTVSNLAYVYMGVALLFATRRPLSRSLGLAGVFLGVGSGLYHASLLPEWRMVDILGVYAVLFSLVALGGCAVFRAGGRRRDFFGAVAVWLLAVPAGIHRNDCRVAGLKPLDSTYVVVAMEALASAGVLGSWRLARGVRRYYGSLAVLCLAAPLAFFGGLADRFGGRLADPNALIQGHTLWHTMGAVALLAAYEAYAATGFDRSVFAPAEPGRHPPS